MENKTPPARKQMAHENHLPLTINEMIFILSAQHFVLQIYQGRHLLTFH